MNWPSLKSVQILVNEIDNVAFYGRNFQNFSERFVRDPFPGQQGGSIGLDVLIQEVFVQRSSSRPRCLDKGL